MGVIVGSNLTNSGKGSASSATTASVSLGSGNLIIVSVMSYFSSGTVTTPTITGASRTWTQIATKISSNNFARITLFRSLAFSSDSGALTIDFGGQTQEGTNWSVDSFTGIDNSGTNGANAIVQSASAEVSGTTTGITVTLSAFSNSLNGTFGATGTNHASPTPAAGSNFTQLGRNGTNESISTEYAASNQTSVDFTWSSDNPVGVAIALELKARAGFLGAMI